jgi:hypothetical protein
MLVASSETSNILPGVRDLGAVGTLRPLLTL